jgi:alcohol dehydrogenase class IV
MPPFEFATAARIVFGEGAAREVAPAARGFGRRALVVTGRTPERAAVILRELDAAVFCVDGEPTVDTLRRGVEAARREQCEVVIGFGGGSAIDAGKAIAALLANGGDALDYLEVVGKGQSLTQPSAPFVAVPTTAGTGSEVTRNSVLGVREHGVKASLRSPHMLPRLAVVDPDLTRDLPPALTASTGLDALTQLIEPYVSVRANPMTDMFCLEGMRLAAGALERACRSGEARPEMAMASLLGGLALANAGLGAVHGFAAPIGGMFPAPHGAVCAALLPHVMGANIRALRERAPGSEALRRYGVVARVLTEREEAEEGVGWVRGLCERLAIPPLRIYGVGEGDVPELVGRALRASSMKGNPIALSAEELSSVLRTAL